MRYVPSLDNPADCLTKPISFGELVAWHDGESCKFLKSEEVTWTQNLEKMDIDIKMKHLLEEKTAQTYKRKRNRKKRLLLMLGPMILMRKRCQMET